MYHPQQHLTPQFASEDNAAVRVEFVEALQPGGEAKALLLGVDLVVEEETETRVIRGGLTDDEKDPESDDYLIGAEDFTITVSDNYDETTADEVKWGRNYYLPGERGKARWFPDTGKFEIIGSYGLLRRAVADAAIEEEDSGTVSIWAFEKDSKEDVEAHAEWGGDAAEGENIWIRYIPDEAKWYILATGATAMWDIRFHIDEYFTGFRVGFCSPRALPPGLELSQVPGLGETPAPDGTVIVCDPIGCYFRAPDMTGREGWAKLMVPLQRSICDDFLGTTGSGSGSSGGLPPRFEVYSICCPRPNCGGP